MPFQPVITACLKDNCKKLQVTDTTDVYNVTTNPTGWQNAATLLAANVDTATIEVWNPGSSLTGNPDITVDVLSQIPDPVTNTIVFQDIFPTGSSFSDGITTIIYTVTDNSTPAVVYSYTATVLFTCNVNCCVDGMFAIIAADAYGNCTCTLDEEIKDALKADALLMSMKSSVASNLNATIVTDLLAMIQRLCDNEDCNCR